MNEIENFKLKYSEPVSIQSTLPLISRLSSEKLKGDLVTEQQLIDKCMAALRYDSSKMSGILGFEVKQPTQQRDELWIQLARKFAVHAYRHAVNNFVKYFEKENQIWTFLFLWMIIL